MGDVRQAFGPTLLTDVAEVAELDPDSADAYLGWFCIRTKPFPCPAEGCDFVAEFVGAAHRITVWPRSADAELLAVVRDARDLDRNPRIVHYELTFGPAIAYLEWLAAGRPVHGMIDRPEGWDERSCS